MDILAIRTPGLGDTMYLFTHEGIGLLVDPQRDVDRFLEAPETGGSDLVFVLETHLHNDYVSGGVRRPTGVGPLWCCPQPPHLPTDTHQHFTVS